MTNLLERLRTEGKQTRTTAETEYRNLLQRADAPEPGDAEKMREVMETLGLATEDVDADLRKLNRAAEYRQKIITPEVEADLKRQYEEKNVEYCQWLRQKIFRVAETIDQPWALWNLLQQAFGQAPLMPRDEFTKIIDQEQPAMNRAAITAEYAWANAKQDSRAAQQALRNMRNDNPRIAALLVEDE